jgi:hypothetical protein
MSVDRRLYLFNNPIPANYRIPIAVPLTFATTRKERNPREGRGARAHDPSHSSSPEKNRAFRSMMTQT